jgi:serine/threonine protein kinase
VPERVGNDLFCEIISGLPPYHNLPHDEFLALKICQGLRPKFNNIKVPPLLEKLIDQCLDADPLKRPTANELYNIFYNWMDEAFKNYKKDSEFCKQHKEAEEFNRSVISKSSKVSLPYATHPQAIYISRLLDYKDLPESQNSKEINDQFYTEFPGNYFVEII